MIMKYIPPRTIIGSLGVVALLFVSLYSQQGNNTIRVRHGEFDNRKVLRMPSEILSQGSNQSPVGTMKAKTYRLERVKLAEPFQVGNVKFEYAYKIIITGGPFSQPYLLWINDRPLPLYPEQREDELVAIFMGTPDF